MNIAVLGTSRINEMLQTESRDCGFSLSFLNDTGKIKSISGAKGSFVIKTADGVTEADYIIVTAQPSPQRVGITAQKGALLLGDSEEIEKLPFSDLPAAFILDYPTDSSAADAREALEKAAALASKKRRVVYVAKNIRTAGEGMESLYRTARKLGVIFYKYDEIKVEAAKDLFRIELYEKENSFMLEAGAAVFAQSAGSDPAFEKLLKLLRIKTETGLPSSADGYYLFPSLTSRAGVYFFNYNADSGSEGELLTQVQFILTDISCDMWKRSAAPSVKDALQNPDGYAEVDTEKCAFCYTCYRACPHAAMAPDNEKSAMKNLREVCTGCGICFSVCPANAITMEGKQEKRKSTDSDTINVFCCSHSGELALKKISERLEAEGMTVTVTPVSCGGEITVESILKALKESDKVIAAVCIDDACRHFEGNKRANREVEKARQMLKASGLEENRVFCLKLSHAMPMVLEAYIREIAKEAPKGMVL